MAPAFLSADVYKRQILAKHGDYCTALGMGEAHIVDAEGSRRRAACMGGMLLSLIHI